MTPSNLAARTISGYYPRGLSSRSVRRRSYSLSLCAPAPETSSRSVRRSTWRDGTWTRRSGRAKPSSTPPSGSRARRRRGRAGRRTLSSSPRTRSSSSTGEALGKPRDRARRAATLARSGPRARGRDGRRRRRTGGSCRAARHARRLRADGAAEIEAYVASGEPDDKAGAYAMQGIGGLFVARVEGSPSNVVGLPVRLLYTLARKPASICASQTVSAENSPDVSRAAARDLEDGGEDEARSARGADPHLDAGGSGPSLAPGPERLAEARDLHLAAVEVRPR